MVINKICKVRDTSLGPAELAFMGMMTSVVLAEVLFAFKCSLNSVPFWFGMTASLLLAWLKSKKCLLGLLTIYCVGLLLSVAGASYSATDALTAYFPMQRIIADGWNPIWDMNQESICAFAGTKSVGSLYIEHCPHLTALVAAMVDKTFGLFSADPFCGIIMMSVVCSLAYRFAMAYWHSMLSGVLLAIGTAVTTKTTNFFAGHVDYTVYSMMLVSLLSLGLWVRVNKKVYLMIFMAAIAGTMASKATGVSFALVCCMVLIACSWKKEHFWKMFFMGLLIVLLLCVSPYVVSIVHHGTPFPSVNLTSDFTGNDDALRMGWLLRCVYAWVSPKLAIGIGKLLYGGSFTPVFNLPVHGYGSGYRFLLLVSLVALIMSRKNFVTVVCMLIFITGNLLPTKYIGFNRYCPQLWCLPLMAILNFLYSQDSSGRISKLALRGGMALTTLIVCAMFGFITLRAIAYFERAVAWHNARVNEIKAMGKISKVWRIEDQRRPIKCTIIKLCKWNGIDVTDGSTAPLASVDVECAIVSASPIDMERIRRFETAFAILNSPGAILRFGWLNAFRNPCL